MDERGEVKEPPPFEKVAEDWRSMGEVHGGAGWKGRRCCRCAID